MSLTLAARFNGPAGSGNGGYTCGRLAEALPGPALGRPAAVAVTLRSPPPLERPLRVALDGDGVARLLDGDILVAEAADGPLPADPVEPVSVRRAVAAQAAYAGLGAHPFPTCFVCGPARTAGDGMRLMPGRLGDGRTACTWTPDASLAAPVGRVAPEFVWAALDCPGGWSADLVGRPMVLGRMAAVVRGVPAVGEPCVVMGRLLGSEGRKTWTASSVYGADGAELGRANAVWISLPVS